jgi:hypothetical protein
MMTPEKQDLIELNTKLQNFVSKLTTIVTNDTSGKTSTATEEVKKFKEKHAANVMKALVNAEYGIARFNAIIKTIPEEEFKNLTNASRGYLRSIRLLKRQEYNELSNLDKVLYKSLKLFQDFIDVAKAMLKFLLAVKSTLVPGHPSIDLVLGFAESMMISCQKYNDDINQLSVVVDELAIVIDQLDIPCQELNQLVHNVREDFQIPEHESCTPMDLLEPQPADTTHGTKYNVELESSYVDRIIQ